MIGIVVAMRMEARPLLRGALDVRITRIGGLRAWTFSLGKNRCTMILSGMGRAPAERAARALVKEGHPRALVSFGIAGALGSALEVGDVVLGQRSFEAGGDATAEGRDLAQLPSQAREAARRAAENAGARLHDGDIVTVKGLNKEQATQAGEAAVEMETAAVAEVAAESSLPLFGVRSISDTPSRPIPLIMDGGDEFRIRALPLLMQILRRPRILPALVRSGANSARAAEVCARAVKAALEAAELAP